MKKAAVAVAAMVGISLPSSIGSLSAVTALGSFSGVRATSLIIFFYFLFSIARLLYRTIPSCLQHRFFSGLFTDDLSCLLVVRKNYTNTYG